MVRRALAADAPPLAALHARSFGAARWSAAQIAGSLALATTHAVALEEGGVLRGFILCQMSGDEAEVLTLCVDPAARRKGGGRRLLESALAEARQRNIRRVFLEVAVDNKAALALYEKADFRPNGARRAYYRREGKTVDAVMLELDL